MRKYSQHFFILALVVSIITGLFVLLIPQNAKADYIADRETDEAPISYQQKVEQKYIFDYLLSKGVDNWIAMQLIGYLDRSNYYEKTPAQKAAFLQNGFQQKQLLFWKQLPQVIAVERSKGWANGLQYQTIDMSYKTCYGDDVKTKARAAMELFSATYCKAFNDGDKNSFLDKQKWQAEQLNQLYTNLWPDLANFRYRPAFNDQETSRLKAYKTYADSKINCAEPKLEDITMDTALMVAPIGGGILKGAEVAGNRSLISGLTRNESGELVIGAAPVESLADAIEAILARRWSGSVYSNTSELAARDVKAKEEFIKTMTGGKIKFMTNSEATNFYENNFFVASLSPREAGRFSPFINVTADGSRAGIEIDSGLTLHLDRDFKVVVTHETTHYKIWANTKAYSADPPFNVTEVLNRRGVRIHKPFEEAFADYIAYYSNGFEYAPGADRFSYGIIYSRVMHKMVNLIMIKKNMTQDQAVNYLYQVVTSGNLEIIANTVFRGDAQWLNKLELLMAQNDFSKILEYLSSIC